MKEEWEDDGSWNRDMRRRLEWGSMVTFTVLGVAGIWMAVESLVTRADWEGWDWFWVGLGGVLSVALVRNTWWDRRAKRVWREHARRLEKENNRQRLLLREYGKQFREYERERRGK